MAESNKKIASLIQRNKYLIIKNYPLSDILAALELWCEYSKDDNIISIKDKLSLRTKYTDWDNILVANIIIDMAIYNPWLSLEVEYNEDSKLRSLIKNIIRLGGEEIISRELKHQSMIDDDAITKNICIIENLLKNKGS